MPMCQILILSKPVKANQKLSSSCIKNYLLMHMF